MTQMRYTVTFQGEIQPNHQLEQVKTKLAELTKQSPAKVEQLFSGKVFTLAKEVDEKVAQRFQAIFAKAGAICHLETTELAELVGSDSSKQDTLDASSQPSKSLVSTMRCPKCGFVQPKAAECTSCGIFVEAYLEAQAQRAAAKNPKPQPTDANDDEATETDELPEVTKKSKKKIALKVAAVVVPILLLFFAMPYLALYQMEAALKGQDAEKFNKYINFPILRENLKGQLSGLMAEMQKTASQNKGNEKQPFAGMEAAMAIAFLSPMIDQFVTPEGVTSLMQQAKSKGEIQQANSEIFQKAKLRYASLSEFHVKITEKDSEVILVLERFGLVNWQVSNVILPKDLSNFPIR